MLGFANQTKGSETVERWTPEQRNLSESVDEMFRISDLAIHAIFNRMIEHNHEIDRHLRELPRQEQPIPADHSGNGEGSTSPDQFDGTSTPLVA